MFKLLNGNTVVSKYQFAFVSVLIRHLSFAYSPPFSAMKVFLIMKKVKVFACVILIICLLPGKF